MWPGNRKKVILNILKSPNCSFSRLGVIEILDPPPSNLPIDPNLISWSPACCWQSLVCVLCCCNCWVSSILSLTGSLMRTRPIVGRKPPTENRVIKSTERLQRVVTFRKVVVSEPNASSPPPLTTLFCCNTSNLLMKLLWHFWERKRVTWRKSHSDNSYSRKEAQLSRLSTIPDGNLETLEFTTWIYCVYASYNCRHR